MKKNNLLIIWTIIILSLLNLSCSSDNIDNDVIELVDNFYIQSYHTAYVQFDHSWYTLPDSDKLVKLEYDNQNRMNKKIGGMIQTSVAWSSVAWLLTDSIYTDFEYVGNKIHLIEKTSPYSNIHIPENKTTNVLDNDNKIIQKIIFKEKNNIQISNYDTINYTYDNYGKLISYLKTSTDVYQNISRRNLEKSDIYYSNENVDSIITISSTKYSDLPYIKYNLKETKKFGGYDSAQNPFRKLQLFEETFNRSLSKNNFTEYEETFDYYSYLNSDYSQTPTLVPSGNFNSRTWSFAYDENGDWIYDQF